jgi:hypothetical protein
MFDSNHLLLEQRRKDLVREREMHNLAKEAKAAAADNPSDSPFYAEALATFGRQLITWGQQLEERYTIACDDSPQLSAES